MSLTTEQITEILFKVTGVSPGLFQETGSRKLGVIEAKTFYCDTEGEDYTCMIKGGQVYEIKNDSNTWNEEYIKHMIAPRPAAQTPVAATANTTLHQAVMPPVQLTNPVLNISISQQLLQAAADLVNLNPGCITSQLDPAYQSQVDEKLLHLPTAWYVGNVDGLGDSLSFSLNVIEPSISTFVSIIAEFEYDSSTQTITSSHIEVNV